MSCFRKPRFLSFGLAAFLLLSAGLITRSLAQSGDDAELEAQIKELEASRKDADPAMQKTIDAQIESMKQLMELQKKLGASGAKAPTAPLAPEMKEFFTAAGPAPVGAWISDTTTRKSITDAMMKCPKGTRVYKSEDNVSCATRATVPIPNGLDLGFYKSTGKLRSQGVYEKGLLKWDILYHATGGRSAVTAYADVEPKVHRENGLATRYATGGTVTSQAEFKAGVRQGWTKLWEVDGRPTGATRYDNGVAVEEVLPDGKKRKLP